MSDAFTRLERQLREKVRDLPSAGTERQTNHPKPRLPHTHALRLVALALLLVLAVTAIALAAGGVILTGAAVRPEARLNPNVGEGVPAPRAAKLLSLRVADPAGGPPWGVRLVSTTRGEVCVQIGRVQDGRLGVLGVDGAFKDDGAFHPIPPSALPRDVYHGRPFESAANETTSCHLSGQAVTVEHIGVDRSAAPKSHVWVKPISQLRDVYFGLLGKQALSIRYRVGRALRTQPVLRPGGAYLIVTAMHRHQHAGYGGEAPGEEGQLPPSPPLSRIVYRLHGVTCERGPSLAPWQHSHVEKPCPQTPRSRPQPFRNILHAPLHLKLHVHHHRITGATLTFTAPFAVRSAHEDYTIRSLAPCGKGATCGIYEMLQRNVKAGALVTVVIPEDPFVRCAQRTATVELLYGPPFASKLRVGAATVRRPPSAC